MNGPLGMHDAFFAPKWRRVAVIVICAVWALAELGRGAPMWAALFAGIGAFSVYQFFIVWPDEEADKRPDE